MKKNAATRRHAIGLRQGSASGRGTDCRNATALHPGEHEPEHGQRQRYRGEEKQRVAPASERVLEWDSRRRRHSGADVDPCRIDAGGEYGAIGEPFLDGDGQQRVAQSHADTDRDRQEYQQHYPRDDHPCDPEHADQRERRGQSVARAEPLREERRRRREQAHAENGNRREHADNRMRRVQVELNRRDQRAEADQLRSQRQRSEEERDEE